MAEVGVSRSRTANNTEAENNLITPNGVFGNTPPRVRQADADLGASAPNFTDDNFSINGDGSHEYTVDPTGAWDTNPTHDQKFPNKLYVDDRLSYLDTTTYYLSNEGDDAQAVPGLENKPFGTVTAIVAAMSAAPPSAKLRLFIYPGTYSGDFNITSSLFKLTVYMSGVTWTSGKFTFVSFASVDLTLPGCEFNNSGDDVFDFGVTIRDISMRGRCIINVDGANNNGIFSYASGYYQEVDINATSGAHCIEGGSLDFLQCKFEADDGFVISGASNFNVTRCEMTSNNVNGCVKDFSGTPSSYYQCNILNTNGPAISAFDNNSSSFFTCRIESTSVEAVELGGNGIWDSPFTYRDCIIIGATDCVSIPATATTSTDVYFEYCRLEAGTGAIFLEPTYNVGFVNKIRSINNYYNKPFTPDVQNKIIEYNPQVQ